MSLVTALGVAFFDDKLGLKRCLDSAYKGFDYMICVDGRYKWFPSKHELSTDGSREVVRSYDNAVLVSAPNLMEVKKRQVMLDACGIYKVDVLCVLDSDEYFDESADWKLFNSDLQDVIIRQCEGRHNIFAIMGNPEGSEPDRFTEYPRIWYRPENMEYYKRHYVFRRKYHPKHNPALQQLCMPSGGVIRGVKFWHDKSLRNQEHHEGRVAYQAKLIEYEGRAL